MIVYASVVEPNNEGLEENISYTLINMEHHGTYKSPILKGWLCSSRSSSGV